LALRLVKRVIAGNRWVLLAVACLLLLPLVCYAAGEWYRDRDFQARFAQMHGGLAGADVELEEEADAHRVYSVRFDNGEGIAVNGLLKVPAAVDGRRPAMVILGGVRTGRRTIDYLRGTRGIVLLALDYPYEGKKEKLSAGEFLGSIGRMRRAVIHTVPAAMLAVDYLLTREDVDGRRITVVGGSVGAVFAPAVAAADARIAAAAMLFGAADLQALMSANLDMPGVLAGPVAWLGAVLTSPVEPAKYVGRISPRPVFMLNGTGDPRMPEHCSRRLHEAARDPKTIRWIDAGHVNIRSTEFHRLVSRELADWMVANDLIEPGSLVDS
jgi:dienelactone hydrolase